MQIRKVWDWLLTTPYVNESKLPASPTATKHNFKKFLERKIFKTDQIHEGCELFIFSYNSKIIKIFFFHVSEHSFSKKVLSFFFILFNYRPGSVSFFKKYMHGSGILQRLTFERIQTLMQFLFRYILWSFNVLLNNFLAVAHACFISSSNKKKNQRLKTFLWMLNKK